MVLVQSRESAERGVEKNCDKCHGKRCTKSTMLPTPSKFIVVQLLRFMATKGVGQKITTEAKPFFFSRHWNIPRNLHLWGSWDCSTCWHKTGSRSLYGFCQTRQYLAWMRWWKDHISRDQHQWAYRERLHCYFANNRSGCIIAIFIAPVLCLKTCLVTVTICLSV